MTPSTPIRTRTTCLLLSMIVGLLAIHATTLPTYAVTFNAERPELVYLTLRSTPGELTVHWISSDLQPPRSVVSYRLGSKADAPLKTAVGKRTALPQNGSQQQQRHRYFVHRVMLPIIPNGTTCRLQVPTTDREIVYHVPDNRSPSVAIAGDLTKNIPNIPEALAQIQQTEPRPQVLVLAGNILHDSGKMFPGALDRWLGLLHAVTQQLTFPDAAVTDTPQSAIPLMVLPGRKDIDFKQPVSPDRAGYMALLFPQIRDLPQIIDFGEALRLLLLEAGYIQPIEGPQQKAMQAMLSQPFPGWVVPIYAESAYPAAKKKDSIGSLVLRRHWSPAFEKAGVRLAIEHFDHAYKRTQPLRQEGVDSRGVVYIGGGGFGRPERELEDVAPPGDAGWLMAHRPYLARSKKVGHFVLLFLQSDPTDITTPATLASPNAAELVVQAINDRGQVIDQLQLHAQRLTRIDRTFFAMPHQKPEVWLLLGLAVIAVLLWLFLRRQEKRQDAVE